MPVNVPVQIPAGTVSYFAYFPVPSDWLVCNGAALSRTTYGALFAFIGTTYGAGDGSTTFNIPDLRGEFIRGSDSGRGVDSGRATGTAQAGQMPNHAHSVAVSSSTAGGANRAAGSNGALLGYNGESAAQGGTENGSENRPRNVAMLPCIKF